MNRVSGALRRAAGEDRKRDEQSREHPRLETDEFAAPHWVHEINSTPYHVNGHATNSVPENGIEARTTRRRIEEILFGWDLKNLKEFPLVALDTKSPAAEQYKILREQVRKICSERQANVLLITSPIKGDGKTKLAANLAAALALDYEENVILIDADMRSPSLASYFNVKAAPGLSEFLSSKTDIDGANYIQETFVPGLRMIAAGRPSDSAAELLNTEKMKGLLQWLRRNSPAQRIIIDTGPVLSTSDPLVLTRYVDGIMLVVRAGRTPRDSVSKAIKSLNTAQLFGVILNGAELGSVSKYYYGARS